MIALGGGSPIDLGKAMALMVKSDKPLLDYAGVARGKVAAMAPLVAVPTTAGTGSEVSVGLHRDRRGRPQAHLHRRRVHSEDSPSAIPS